ncbi:hypothetical protein [Streptomyces sp. NBC_01446]|uniref:DUF3592 domain-containing protein n=1 Tax=Streptomyces sp. NBC_00119 TaxID=2975659 RepID=A0AAU1U6H1_9ACTN|nr:hypothetical protein [Streptomyces sp. NBC_01446]MCX4643600.1 hypothetical protein [Streptomyces sp. NBC_01446]
MTERARATAQSVGGLPGKGGARRRTPGWTRFMGVLLILLALISAVLCYIAFSWWLPSDRDRYRDYVAAEPCPARATAQMRKDCLSTWHFTVVKTVIKNGGRTSTYKATLKDGHSWQGVVDFGDPGPLLERLETGDRVTATVWRRDIVVLSKDGVRQDSSEAPRDELQMNAAMGMLAAFFAAQALAFGAVRLVVPRAYAPFTWDPYGRRLLFTSIAVCFGVGLPAVWIGIPWWTVPALGLPAMACAAVLMYPRLERTTAGREVGARRKTP